MRANITRVPNVNGNFIRIVTHQDLKYTRLESAQIASKLKAENQGSLRMEGKAQCLFISSDG